MKVGEDGRTRDVVGLAAVAAAVEEGEEEEGTTMIGIAVMTMGEIVIEAEGLTMTTDVEGEALVEAITIAMRTKEAGVMVLGPSVPLQDTVT